MADRPPQIFDRKLYAERRKRALARNGDVFLAVEAAALMAERLSGIKRTFETALALNIRPECFEALRPHADKWIAAPNMPSLTLDEEALPFAEGSFNLIVSILSLHAVNDLPGTLIQIRRALKPDGLFLAALFGGETLHELRAAFAAAEGETMGGVSPRVAPFADVRDMGSLLQRAGFALPVTDVERTIVRYRRFETLIEDLRALGETNMLIERLKRPLRRDTLAAMLSHYQRENGNTDGRLNATFDVVYLAGWAPHESQQKPLRPGSARARLADALGTKEIPAGDAVPPRPGDPSHKH
ncbi:MAG: methyltransferase domain-containing protein [Alphaproteobacteria bacterium]|jgi:SAM-dependent methyltransferase|nr:methyltransferase domain-containing protein [Alphaproteobacteria bacterium]OJU56215.1 MAG: SAM-dependent methyltransferase [Alphaproteobacteria bacterium 62-8]